MLNAGGNLKASDHRVCVVYDAHSGRIIHIHHDITLQKGPHVSEADIEAAALAQVRKRGRHTDNVAVLHTKPHELQPHVRYKVDPHRRVLERVPA